MKKVDQEQALAVLQPSRRRPRSTYICAVSLIVLLAFRGLAHLKTEVSYLITSSAATTVAAATITIPQKEAAGTPPQSAVVVEEENQEDKIALRAEEATVKKISKRKPRAVLHIGPHKVASTYVQSCICKEDYLLHQLQFVSPTAREGVKHTACVAFHLQNSLQLHQAVKACPLDPIAELKRSLQDSGGNNIILSSEEFDNLDDVGVSQLADLLQKYETTVVLYHRRKLGHIISYYTEWNKASPNPLSFTEFVWEFINPLELEGGWSHDHIVKINGQGGFKNPLARANGLIYTKLLDLYGRHFGGNNLVIFSYEGLKKARMDPWEVLVNDVLGYKGDKYKTPPTSAIPQNVSPDPFMLSVCAAYNNWKWAVHYGDDIQRGLNPGVGGGDNATAAENNGVTDDSKVGQSFSFRQQNAPCPLSQLKPLAEVLPRKCSNFHSFVDLWESQERHFFRNVSSQYNFLYFDKDTSGNLEFPPLAEKDSQVCEVDTAKLVAENDTTASARIATAFQGVCVGLNECQSGTSHTVQN